MVQILPQKGGLSARLGGAIGAGLGQGLAQSIPQEMERTRLAKGLQQLGQQEGLTPFQRFAQLAAIPGITPQMIQSGSELLKQQGIRANLNKRVQGKQGQNEPSFSSQTLQNVGFGNENSPQQSG